MQEVVEKKWNLSNIYQLANEAQQAGDLEQALKLSQKGLKEAELQVSEEWTPKFEQLEQELATARPEGKIAEVAVIVKQKSDLTKVKGIGPKHAQKLQEAGYIKIEMLAHETPQKLASVKGIGLKIAQKFINSAQNYLGTISSPCFDMKETVNAQKNLVNIAQSPPLESTPKQVEPEMVISHEGEVGLLLKEEIGQDFEEDISKEIEEKDELTSFYDENIPLEIEKEETLPVNEAKAPSQTTNKEPTNLFREEIIESILETDFHLVSNDDLYSYTPQIDQFAFKEVTFNNRKIILLCLIKLCENSDALVVSESGHQHESNRELDLMVETGKNQLVEVAEKLRNGFQKEDHAIEYILKYLRLEVQKQGELKSIVHIDNVIVNSGQVEFIETDIPFAYQRESDVYYISKAQISAFLNYLEKKYSIIAETTEERFFKPPENNIYQHLQHYIPFYSIPFVGFGFLLFVVALSQAGTLLQFFIGLSYAILGAYGAIIGYMGYCFFQSQNHANRRFIAFSHPEGADIDDATVELISHELPDDLMLQLGYEWYGKEATQPKLVKIKQKHAEKFVSENAPKKQSFDQCFESQDSTTKESSGNQERRQRYSDFLEK